MKSRAESYQDGFRNGYRIACKEIFAKFDEYSAIKDDKWYKELKEKLCSL